VYADHPPRVRLRVLGVRSPGPACHFGPADPLILPPSETVAIWTLHWSTPPASSRSHATLSRWIRGIEFPDPKAARRRPRRAHRGVHSTLLPTTPTAGREMPVQLWSWWRSPCWSTSPRLAVVDRGRSTRTGGNRPLSGFERPHGDTPKIRPKITNRQYLLEVLDQRRV